MGYLPVGRSVLKNIFPSFQKPTSTRPKVEGRFGDRGKTDIFCTDRTLNGNFYEYKLLLMDDTQRTRLIEGYRLRIYVNPIGKLLMSKQRKTL